MNQRQANASNMYDSLMKFLDNNRAVWESLLPIKEKHDELKSTLDELNRKLQDQQAKSTQGFTKDKQAALEELTGLCFKMALKLKAYAKKTGNLILLQKVDFSESELERASTREILSRSRLVLQAAAENLAGLSAYRITEKEVADLKQAIEKAEPKTAERDVLSGERSSVTASISALYTQALEEVTDLDVLIEGMIDDDQEDFINGYFTIRRINDRRGRKRKTEEKEKEENVVE